MIEAIKKGGCKKERVIVEIDDSESRLDRWFRRRFKGAPIAYIAKLIRKGVVEINGKKSKISYRLKLGDAIDFPTISSEIVQNHHDDEWHINKKHSKLGKLLSDSVLYIDENVLILNKPAGLATQPGSKVDISVDKLGQFLRFDKEDNPKLVHRLDKPTSGVLVLGRSHKSAALLSELIRDRGLSRYYVALVCGKLPKSAGIIDLPLQRGCHPGGVFDAIQCSKGERPKNALTIYKVLDSNPSFSLVRFEIKTGRTHQIRAHSAALGCHVLGDDKYSYGRKPKLVNIDGVKRNGDRRDPSDLVRGTAYVDSGSDNSLWERNTGMDAGQKVEESYLYLHAIHISFSLFGKKIDATAELPPYFKRTLERIGLSIPLDLLR